MATKKTEEIKDTQDTIKEKKVAYEDERVPVFIPRDRNDNSDVTVTVNGKRFTMQRGVKVEVPRYVAEVLENAQRMEDEAYRYIEEINRNAADVSRHL